MAQDFAKKRKPAANKKKSTARKKEPTAASSNNSGWRWYGAGVLTGVFLCFLVYLGTLPPTNHSSADKQIQAQNQGEDATPKPRFDFYTLLPEHTIEVEVEESEVAKPRAATTSSSEFYLLQAGSFRQREDADRRRAELLLLGLEPRVEESSGDNGRWFRVYLGPFNSRSTMSRARSLTAQQDIDTLLLKRNR